MTYGEILENTRKNIGKYCRACPVCNGADCRGQIPGPGAKGGGDGAMRNFSAWKNIRVNMDTLVEGGPISTKPEIFGRTFDYPFLPAL